MIKQITLASLILTSACLSGCFLLYRPTITQGNLINESAVAQLRPGLTENQVLYLMGTPVLSNTFQPYRWDYVYTIKKGGEPRFQRHVTLFFINGIVRNVQVSPPEMVKQR